jgi:hypothetical protein
MAEIIIKESQLKLIKGELAKQSEMRLAEEKWNKFSDEEKEFLVEFLKAAYPKKTKLIKESWYNTLGDIVGIFDPTGVVDLVNGISYISQGENLFGFLSIISAIPYAGDLVAKPVMGALKLGKPSAKALNGVLSAAKKANTTEEVAKVSADLAKLSNTGGITGTFVKGVGKIAPTIKNVIERIPGGFVTSGLKKTILGWIELFEKAAVSGKAVRTQGSKMAELIKGVPGGAGVIRLSKADRIKGLEDLVKLSKETPGVFSGYRTTKGLLSWKTVFGGMPQLMGRNKSVRALMRQSKWWLGFLDYVGLGNWVGPDELSKKLGGEEKMRSKMEEYNKTPDAKKNFEDQYGATDEVQPDESNTQSKSSNTGTNVDSDPFAKMISGLFKGALNPIPGI